MRLAELAAAEIGARLRGPGLRLAFAGMDINIWTDLPGVASQMAALYADHVPADTTGVDDFRIRLTFPDRLQRGLRHRTQAYIDGNAAFAPLPMRLAYLFVEATLNWCLGTYAAHQLVLHAAVVERAGAAIIMPGPSGSGKSTLAAALVARGWRLLSDELGIIRPEDGHLLAAPRPISLKNNATALIRRCAPDGYFSPVFSGTAKGELTFLRPPADSVRRGAETALPGYVIAPTFRPGTPVRLDPVGKAEAFRMLVDNALNYRTTLKVGFDTVVRLVETCQVFRLSYDRLEDAADTVERLCR
jgi:HprK-related kinase A